MSTYNVPGAVLSTLQMLTHIIHINNLRRTFVQVYIWGDWGTGKWTNLPKVTWPLSSEYRKHEPKQSSMQEAWVLSHSSHVQLFATSLTGWNPPGWDSLGKNTGVGCHFLLQEIFQTQGSNPCLLHLLYCQAGSLPLAPPGKPIQSVQCGPTEHALGAASMTEELNVLFYLILIIEA